MVVEPTLTATITNNIVSGNSAGHGGGIYFTSLSSRTLTGNDIITNKATNSSGGGIHFGNSSTVTVTDNNIIGNKTKETGGGVHFGTNTTASIINNVISNNSVSSYGGGFYLQASDTTTLIINNTISNNRSSAGNGGGFWLKLQEDDYSANIYNNVIWNNSALAEGNDFYINNDGNSNNTPSPINLFNNDFDQSVNGAYFALSISIDSSNLDNIDPLFVDEWERDYHLQAGSPCINAGDNDAPSLPTTDNDGNPRIANGIVDMGAYEKSDGQTGAGTLQLSTANYNVNERDGAITITATRIGGNDGAVSIEYATTDDTATAPDDYTQTSGTLNWNDGDDADKTFPINITDDSEPENPETLIVSLGNPTGGAVIGSPETATVTITDNEGTVIISVEPAESNLYIGQEFDVNILVKAGTQQVDGASAYLDYETTYLEVISMTAGEHLDTILENSFDNGTGQINYAAGKLNAPYPTGDFELVTIRLKAKAETSGTTLGFQFNPPRRTNATFDGVAIFDHAENGNLQINKGVPIKGSVELQGREPKPHQSWETEIRVTLTVPSETQPRYDITTTTYEDGKFEIDSIDPLTYDMRVKGTHTLQKKVSVTLSPGENDIGNVGTLLEGDCNNDNCVTILDFSILSSTFGLETGDPDYDPRADLNQDGFVTILDFSLLAANFGQCGASDPSMMVSSLLSVSGGTVVMGVVPSTSQVKVGETFEVEIQVQAGEQQVDGASAYLEFDPTLLEVVNMTSGDHLNLTLENSFDNGAGSINFAAGKLTSPFPSGDFELVTISLRAKAATARTPLGFVFNPSRRTYATFGGASVFDYAEDGNIIINKYRD
jgi:parallel beta-helix repeat protein